MIRTTRLLLIDLNNLACYPSIAIGYLVASLRKHGFQVEVLTPLALGVQGLPRERTENSLDHFERRISYSTRPWIEPVRKRLGSWRTRFRERRKQRILKTCRTRFAEEFDAVLISAYTDELDICRGLAQLALEHKLPLLIGGPVFNAASVSEAWARLPGVSAVVGAEVERSLPALVEALLQGEPLDNHAGSFLPDGRRGPRARSERSLGDLPHPDFSDFPWEMYPQRIVPVLGSRGCGWGKCTFCSDIVTTSGRGFRGRTVDDVIGEMKGQSERYETKAFTFIDLKLNSRPENWRELIRRIPREVPGARWIGSIHVESEADSGLEVADLQAAYRAGMRRLTFGLESGSQRILDGMDKGTTIERNERFVREAYAAGISVRATVIQGYPGEEAHDLNRTADLLFRLSKEIDRVRINRLNMLEGSRLTLQIERGGGEYEGLDRVEWTHENARSTHRYRLDRDAGYRRAVRRVLQAVHRINKKPLRRGAELFSGVL